jgi:hypothetical protein
MKKQILLFTMLAIFGLSSAFATKIIVDINGAGQYTSIQAAIIASAVGDTIVVWPGTYFQQINLNKNIVLQGSGYENTRITWDVSNNNPTITMSTGKIKWFMISSLTSNGILISGGIVTNCVIQSCSSNGIYCNNGNASVYNCNILSNGVYGINSVSPGIIYAVNCISRNNAGAPGYPCYGNPGFYGSINVSYSNGQLCNTSNGQGCVDSDPLFNSSSDYHISQGSPCYNTGNALLSDPDGSRSDMGYFGGPDCPIYPVVYEMTVSPNGNNINVQAKARANY